MKLLGKTQDGEPIVQMSNAEYGSFCALDKVTKGLALDIFPGLDTLVQTSDLSRAIESARMYVTGLNIVNQMQEHLNDMRETLQGEGE